MTASASYANGSVFFWANNDCPSEAIRSMKRKVRVPEMSARRVGIKYIFLALRRTQAALCDKRRSIAVLSSSLVDSMKMDRDALRWIQVSDPHLKGRKGTLVRSDESEAARKKDFHIELFQNSTVTYMNSVAFIHVDCRTR